MSQYTQSDLDMVVDVLSDNANYPEGPAQVVREMLSKGLPYVIGVPHEYQQGLVDMAASVFDEAQKSASKAISNIDVQAQTDEAKGQNMEELLGAARKEFGSANQRAETLASALREAEAKITEADKVNTEAQQAKKAVQKQRSQLTGQKSEIDGVAAALQASEEDKASEVPIDWLLDFLGKAGANEALLAAAPAALRCAVSDRASFDTLVVTEITGFVTRHAANLAAELDTAATTAEDIYAEALGAWALRDVLRERATEAARALSEGEEARNIAEAHCKAVEADLKQQQDVLSMYKVQQLLEQEKLNKLESAAGALKRLAEAAVPVEEEEHAEEADAEMAVEAEAGMEVDQGAEVLKDVPEKGAQLKEDSLAEDLRRIPTPMIA